MRPIACAVGHRVAGFVRFVESGFDNNYFAGGRNSGAHAASPPLILLGAGFLSRFVDQDHAILAFGATVTTPGTGRPNSATNSSMPFKAAESSESAAIG